MDVVAGVAIVATFVGGAAHVGGQAACSESVVNDDEVMFSTQDPLIQLLCNGVHFTQCAIWKVPLRNPRLMEVGRQLAHLHRGDGPEDAEHWAFIASAETDRPTMPKVFFIAQYGIIGEQDGVVRTGVCSSLEHCQTSIRRFVSSTSDVKIRGAWTAMQGSASLMDLVDKTGSWQGKPYELLTNNCQNFAEAMIRHFGDLSAGAFPAAEPEERVVRVENEMANAGVSDVLATEDIEGEVFSVAMSGQDVQCEDVMATVQDHDPFHGIDPGTTHPQLDASGYAFMPNLFQVCQNVSSAP